MASVVLSYLIKQPYKEEILEHFDTNKGHESWSSYLSVSRDVCLDYKRKKGIRVAWVNMGRLFKDTSSILDIGDPLYWHLVFTNSPGDIAVSQNLF